MYVHLFPCGARLGYFGRGKQVQAPSVSSVIMAIGKAIALVHEINPKKCPMLEKCLPRLQEMFEGWRKEDPPTMKKLSVEPDLPDCLVEVVLTSGATEKEKVVRDRALIA